MIERLGKEAKDILQLMAQFTREGKDILENRGLGEQSWITLQIYLRELVKATSNQGDCFNEAYFRQRDGNKKFIC